MEAMKIMALPMKANEENVNANDGKEGNNIANNGNEGNDIVGKPWNDIDNEG